MKFLIEMEFLFNFSTLIQLISAVNFANITFKFHEKIFHILFDIKNIYEIKFRKIENEMSVDMVSLEAMKPIVTQDDKSNNSKIQDLLRQYKDLYYEWKNEYDKIKQKIEDCINVKGVRSLFLFVSLYCIYNLTLIAVISLKEVSYNWNLLVYNINIISTIICIYYTFKIFRKNDKREDVRLYKQTLYLSLISVIFSIINVFVINKLLIILGFNFSIPYSLLITFSLISIILPFFPCILCVIYIYWHEYVIDKNVVNSTSPLIEKHNKLHKDKVILDKMYIVFQKDENPRKDVLFN